MRYALIDNDGELHVKDAAWPDIARELGEHGTAAVRLAQATPLRGFRGHVSDCGLAMPDIYPRNVIGSLVLFSLEGGIQPYAGPVVITGFATLPVPDVTGLDQDMLDLVRMAHSDVRRALAGNPEPDPAHADEWKPGEWRQWAGEQPELAELVRTGQAPGIRIIRGTDLLGGGL
ncbi:hypothetical protein Ssi03_62120 [Sphaerisporangium siamense]|uniref:DUF3846 domain-containing protein n=1 Tax=Sphaerisporangium siamense TaxID=795645 RepID=A0A7W7D913_9ACTN|nr:hypothetical protein [Sphaerisporangium siamense]MBB4702523.1 hypothetical protein [Sphaerisporangium siamense]GII88222.1 hypothetical protein Ssi03_62120 [Sphaerisporangium siamense]